MVYFIYFVSLSAFFELYNLNFMRKFTDYFREIHERAYRLIKEHQINTFDFDCEFVYESKDMAWFAEALCANLFPDDHYKLSRHFTSEDSQHYIVEFFFNEELIQMKTVTSTDFIDGDYFFQLKDLVRVSKHGIKFNVLPNSLLISGKPKTLLAAQKEGLPITVSKRDFFSNIDIDGKKLKESKLLPLILELEKGYSTDYVFFQNQFFKGVQALHKHSVSLKNLSIEQIGIYFDQNGKIQIMVNGDKVVNYIKFIDETQLICDRTKGGYVLAYGILIDQNPQIKLLTNFKDNLYEHQEISRVEFMKMVEEKI